jgi:diguanylate cyclase
MDLWHIEIPAPVALAFLAAMGYLVSRWRRPAPNELVIRSRRELKRAQAVAQELERITSTVRQNLAKHYESVSRFRDRVSRLRDHRRDPTWKELCREAEEVLKPTLQLATQIAAAYDELRRQGANLMTFTEVRTDPLTGINNRRGLDDAIAAQLALMARYHSLFSVVIFDIDHFKEVNDREGHVGGDRVLQELARLLDENVRETDLVARYGGEEFVIVMPHTDLAGAGVFAERLRAEVAGRMTITISGGAAEAEEDDSAEALIARADTALYGAKTAGRNRIFCHTSDSVEPVVPVMEIPTAAAALAAAASA